MLTRDEAVSFARSAGWASRLPPALQESLLAAARLRTLPAGSRLYAIGDGLGPIYFLARGCLAAEASPSVAPPMMSMLHYPGAWLGEGVTASTHRRVGVWATRQSAVLSVDAGDFRRVAASDPGVWRHVALLALENHYRTMGLAHDLMIRGGRRRLSAILARMAGLRDEVVPDPLVIDATQAEIAEVANLARSVVSSFLQEMEREGILRLSWGAIEVLSPKRLLGRVEAA